MKKYYLNDGSGQQGPFSLEELKEKNLKPESPVWYEGMDNWTTAGQLEELKTLFAVTPPPYVAPVSTTESSPVEAASTVATASAVSEESTAKVNTPDKKHSKKKTAWLSWVLYLLVLGGAGYYVYQDMENNKTNAAPQTLTLNSQSSNTADAAPEANNNSEKNEAKTENNSSATTEPTASTTTEDPKTEPIANSASSTGKTTTAVVSNDKTKAASTKVQTDAQKIAAKKAEEEKKRLQAEAQAAKEREFRNNWPKYIRIGNLDIKKDDDGVEAFNVPVFNGTSARLDKVTLRVDYMKKEKKVVKSETVVIYGIPPGAGLYGYAPESKKGNNIKVYITAISSTKLHFCFPENNGNPADPYFCK